MTRQRVGSANRSASAGLLADLPPDGSLVDGSSYLATDQYGGTPYEMVDGVWVPSGAGVGQASGLTVAGPVKLSSAFDVKAVGTTKTDVTGMSLAVPASSRPVKLRFRATVCLNGGTATSGALLIVKVVITDSANNILAAVSPSALSSGASALQVRDTIVEYNLPAPVAAAAYKVRAFTGQAVPSGWTIATIDPTVVGNYPAATNDFEAITC